MPLAQQTKGVMPEAPPDCPICPRLVAFRAANRAAHPDWFNGAVPSFGPETARLLIVGLAPGLKGANRTGRPFLGDYAGELLYRTSQDVMQKLEGVRIRLTDSREKPTGTLRITTTVALGSTWLTQRINEFVDLHPDLNLHLILDDQELDLTMRQADVAIRLRQPVQPDLIQRRLFTAHYHVYAAPSYVERFGKPETLDDLDNHDAPYRYGRQDNPTSRSVAAVVSELEGAKGTLLAPSGLAAVSTALLSVLNAGDETRIHLVVDTVGGERFWDLLAQARPPGQRGPDWRPVLFAPQPERPAP